MKLPRAATVAIPFITRNGMNEITEYPVGTEVTVIGHEWDMFSEDRFCIKLPDTMTVWVGKSRIQLSEV